MTVLAFPLFALALAFLFPEAAWSRNLAWVLATPVGFVAGWPFLRVAAGIAPENGRRMVVVEGRVRRQSRAAGSDLPVNGA